MLRRFRSKFPSEWRVPNNPKPWTTWARARSKLSREQVYWKSPSSRQGRSHAAPVWGIWRSDVFFFETDPNSIKGRNLRSNPADIVHIQDGPDPPKVEGSATLETASSVLAGLVREYTHKCYYSPDCSENGPQVVFRVHPRVAHTWHAPRAHTNLVDFIFREGSIPREARTS